MRRILVITAVVGTAAALGLAALAVAPVLPTGTRPAATPSAGAGRAAGPALAPRFEPNLGQADRQVRFLSRGQGYTMLMTGTGAVLKLRRPADPAKGTPAPQPSRPAADAVVGLTFEGANPDPVVAGNGRLPGVSNYLLGSDPGGWITGVPNYSRVSYRGLYQGVDLDWYANRAGELEFDLTLAPGVDPAAIRLSYTGVAGLEVDGAGGLVLEAGGHRLRQAPPVVYQRVDGARRELRGRYVLHGDGGPASTWPATTPRCRWSSTRSSPTRPTWAARATTTRSGATSTAPATSTSPARRPRPTSPPPPGPSSAASAAATATPS
jgi:hypothetical protein